MPIIKRHRPAERNPLCEFALTIDDIRPGLTYVEFNTRLGIIGRGRITKKPHDGWVEVESNRLELRHSLEDMGVIRYKAGHWNPTNFTILAHDTHRLPPPDLAQPTNHETKRDWPEPTDW